MIKPTSLKDLVNMYIMETDVITFNQPDKHVTDCTFFFLRKRESINYTVQAQLMLTALSIWVNAQYDKFK